MEKTTRKLRLIYIIASCVVYLAMWLAVPHIAIFRHPAAMFAVTAVFMLVQLSVTRWFTSFTMKPVWALGILTISLAAWLSVIVVVTAPYTKYEVKGYPIAKRLKNPPATIPITMQISTQSPSGKPNAGKPQTVTITAVRKPSDLSFRLLVFDSVAGGTRSLTSLLMIIAASAFGYMLSFILRNKNILMPVAAFAPFIDIWTVFFGPTGHALKTAPHVVRAVSVAMPAPPSVGQGVQPASFVGPADLIFLAMFFGALYRLNMEPRRTFWLLFPAMTFAMVALAAIPLIPGLRSVNLPGLPALVFIGLAFIIGNYKHFKLKRDEWIAMGIVALLLLGITLAGTVYFAKGR
jgi:hypothetical protein